MVYTGNRLAIIFFYIYLIKQGISGLLLLATPLVTMIMSRTSVLLLVSFFALSFLGCGTMKVNCTDQTNYVIVCSFNRAMNKSTDTFMHAVAYKKGSDFSIPVDTTYNAGAGWDSIRIVVHLDQIKLKCDEYDWQLIFYKTGEVFKIKNITHQGRSEKQASGDTHACSNNMSLIVNDSLIHIDGDDGQFAPEVVIHVKQ
ncbi:MAG: hypothetical protein JWQ38_545 [Flavipsychrobacter sp.]|nr:hypothetical protein [Flavipsychrobacter sp.]